MHIQTERYETATSQLPPGGKHIIAHQSDNEIVVYQAYQTSIADYAVKHQAFGGNDYSYNRMS